MIEIVTKRDLLKQIIDRSIEENREILVLFYGNNNYITFKGDEKKVGDILQLLSIPQKISLVFHTHPPGMYPSPSVSDVEMSIFLHRYPQYRSSVFAVGSIVNNEYVICYWSFDTIDFQLLNKVEHKIFTGEGDPEENREKIKEAIGLQCINLDSISLTEIAEQEQLNFYRKIDAMIQANDYIVFEENINEIRDTIEKMYPILEKYYDYVNDIYRNYKGVVYTYYLLLSVDNKKVRYSKMVVYGNKKIEVMTMTATDENIIRIGNKEYTVKMLKDLCKSKSFCVVE